MEEELFTNNTPANNQTGNENINNTQLEPNQNILQDANNNGIPDSFEFAEKQDTTFVPQGNAFDNAYKSEEAIAKDIPDYKKYKWYKQPGEGYFYSTGEKIEEAIESNPEEVKETLNEIAEDDNGISKEDVQPLIKEAEQVTDGDERTSEVNDEVVDKTLENPKIASFLDDELANFNEDDVIDEPDWEFDENAVSEEDIHPEGSTIIEDFDFKDPFERMNKKDLKEKAKRIEKDIPIPKLTKKDIRNKIINAANEGVEEDEISKIQKAYAEAKKPTKYEKEAAKAAGLIDNESVYEKMSKKEKKKVNEEIDKILEEQKKAGDERRAKEATKERVNKFFKPLQYERKVYANGRNRVLPKGTFMSPDGTEYYNPETETIEQVIEEPEEKEEEKKKKKKDWLKLFGTAKGEPINTEVSNENAENKPINEPIKSGVTPGSFIPNFVSGSGVSNPSISTDNRESETNDNATSSIKVDNREQDNNAGSVNGTTVSNKHLEDTFDNLKFDEAKEKDIKSDGQALVGGDVIHHTSNNAGVDISGLVRNNTGNNAGIDIKDLIRNSAGKNTLPFKFFFDGDDIIVAEIGTGRKLPLDEFIKAEPNSANRIIEVLNELI